jgi:hypothetical protein
MTTEGSKRPGNDWRLWWVGISVVLGAAVYSAVAPNWLAFALSALLGAVAILLNHDRLVKVDSANTVKKSVQFAVLVFALLALLHQIGINLSDRGS